ncbi:MAG: UDP-3-O-(3-hydroxymyristoyl)glucosamine N-acyltransferase [bacterium]|nr:UDP-3-O-(3-hydroxymyristoyl)glucosamine N-acyltransferase [bacterium]
MKLKEIADFVKGILTGPADLEIIGIARIEEAKPGELSWFSHPRYKKWLSKTQASCVVVLKGEEGIPGVNTIKVENLAIAMESLLLKFYPLSPMPAVGISKLSAIGKNVKMGKNVSIGDFVCIGYETVLGDNTIVMDGAYIGNKVRIGNDCQIHPNAVIKEDVFLGNRVIIGSGTVVGSDGFAYNRITTPEKNGDYKYKRMPHRGGVILEDDVEVGANSTIDKSVIGNTIVKKGTKLDNLVHVAHNVIIGENSILCAQVGIAGSVNIGNNVVIAGQAGVPDHITVGDNVVIAAQSGVTKDIPAGITVSGFPARPHIESNRAYSLLIDLPDLFKRVKKLEEQSPPRRDVPCKQQ